MSCEKNSVRTWTDLDLQVEVNGSANSMYLFSKLNDECNWESDFTLT